MHVGEVRAKILDVILALQSGGLARDLAVKEVRSVCRTTVYRWFAQVRGRPRGEWPQILLSQRLKVQTDCDRDKIWQAMRISKGEFAYSDIETISEADSTYIRLFACALARAGYLQSRTVKGVRRGSRRVWRLTRNSGPHAPRVLRTGEVYDPNDKAVYGRKHEVRRG